MATQQKKPADVEVFDWSLEQPGQGFEHVTQVDLGVPFLQIIQKMSPEVDKTTNSYLKGCEPGDIINTVTRVIVGKENKPACFIPCNYQRMYVEWRPREVSGGGFVAAHADVSILDCTKRNSKNQDQLANGNIIVTTAYVYGVLVRPEGLERCVIGFSSTQLKKARQWLSTMMGIKLDGPSGKFTPPMFSHMYALSTQPESNEKGTWYGWKIELRAMVNQRALVEECKHFNKTALPSMAVRTAIPETAQSLTEGDDKF